MKIPEFTFPSKNAAVRRPDSTFGGLNRTPGVGDGEFADDNNMTSDGYPALSSRDPYGLYKVYDSARAMRQVPLIAWNDGLVELVADEDPNEYDHLYYKGEKIDAYHDASLSRYGFNPPPIIAGRPAEHREAVCFNKMVIFLPYMTYFDTSDLSCGKLYNVRNFGVGAVLCPVFEDGNYILAASVVGQDFPQAASAGLPTASGQDLRTIAGRWDDDDRNGAEWVYQTNFKFRIDYPASGSYPSIDSGFDVGDVVDVQTMTVEVGGSDVELGLGTQFRIDELGEGYIVISAGAFDSVAFAGLMQKCIAAVPGTTRKKSVTLKHLMIARNVPTLAFACVQNNRIFGCDTTGHEIYACYQGDPFVWYNYGDSDLSAWTATVGTPGVWSGCAAYEYRVLFFKHDRIHVLAGSYPSAFSLSDVETPGAWSSFGTLDDVHTFIEGCTDGIPITVSGGAVWYGGTDGIYRWYGGQATRISAKLGEGRYYFYDAFSAGGKIYFTVWLPGEIGIKTVVYDPRRDIWHKIACLATTSHVERDGGALCLSGNCIYAIGLSEPRTEAGPIAWSVETGPLVGIDPDYRYISKIQIVADFGAESELVVDLMYDEDGLWHRYSTLFPMQRRVRLIPVTPRRCGSCRMRISGLGKVTIFSVSYCDDRSSEFGRT